MTHGRRRMHVSDDESQGGKPHLHGDESQAASTIIVAVVTWPAWAMTESKPGPIWENAKHASRALRARARMQLQVTAFV